MDIDVIKAMFLSLVTLFVVYFCGLVMVPPILHMQNAVVFGILTFTVLSYLRALYVIYNK